jgi:hypothetical protein
VALERGGIAFYISPESRGGCITQTDEWWPGTASGMNSPQLLQPMLVADSSITSLKAEGAQVLTNPGEGRGVLQIPRASATLSPGQVAFLERRRQEAGGVQGGSSVRVGKQRALHRTGALHRTTTSTRRLHLSSMTTSCTSNQHKFEHRNPPPAAPSLQLLVDGYAGERALGHRPLPPPPRVFRPASWSSSHAAIRRAAVQPTPPR